MPLRLTFVAALIVTLAGCQMEAGSGGGFNPGTAGSDGFNPGSGSRPPLDPGAGSRPPAGIVLARQVCTVEAERRGTGVRILSEHDIKGGVEIRLRTLTRVPPIKTQLVRCRFSYDTGRATIL
jgi:hypothetical protein